MQLIRRPERHLSPSPLAVAIGNFDGLHMGHRAVITEMKSLAARAGLTPTVLTFEPHPRSFFAPHTPPFKLEPLHMKLRRLRAAGVERVVIPRFNADFAALSPEQFLNDVLASQLKAKIVVTGENFAFGAKRAGTSDMLRTWGIAQGVTVETVKPVVMTDGTICSSTAVRQALMAGDMARAQQLLGRPYAIIGPVVHGDKRGAGLGFPTANMNLPPQVKLPAYGVYAVKVQVRHSAAYSNKTFDAVANFGLRPTVGHASAPRLEVHLFDFTGNLYGLRLDLCFIARLREEKRFDSLSQLTAQIAIDCIEAKKVLEHGA